MAAFEVIALDTATPQLRAPGSGDTYSLPRTALQAVGALTTAVAAYDITATYNNAAVTFPGALRVNVTNTASNAASNVFDFQVGGSSRLKLRVDGALIFPDSITPTPLLVWQYAGYGIGSNASGDTVIKTNNNNRLRIGANATIWKQGFIGWSSTDDAEATSDLQLYRDGAADTLAQRRSTNAQTFNVYNTYTDASNYERVALKFVSNTARLLVENLGTGTMRNLDIYGGGYVCYRADTNGNAILAPGGGSICLGGTTSSFPSLRYTGTLTKFRDATNGVDTPITVSYVQTVPGTLSSLGSAATAGKGARAYITDATATLAAGIGTAATGGGANNVPVNSDGTNWIIG